MASRLKIVRLSNDAFTALLRLDGSKRLRIVGLPPDARVVGVSDAESFYHDRVCIKVSSGEFEEVPEGTAIPELALECFEVKPGREFL